jgi:hypothetical protein
MREWMSGMKNIRNEEVDELTDKHSRYPAPLRFGEVLISLLRIRRSGRRWGGGSSLGIGRGLLGPGIMNGRGGGLDWNEKGEGRRNK